VARLDVGFDRVAAGYELDFLTHPIVGPHRVGSSLSRTMFAVAGIRRTQNAKGFSGYACEGSLGVSLASLRLHRDAPVSKSGVLLLESPEPVRRQGRSI